MQTLTKFLLLLTLACSACQPVQEQANRAPSAVAPRALPNGHYAWQSDSFYLELAPERGGRMVSLRWKGQELLTPRSTDSLAYGSSLWPSPMTWGWPPPRVLDREPHTANLRGDTLQVTGPRAEDFGWEMQKSLLVWPTEGRFTCWYQITNLTDTLRRVAAWEVPRFPKGSEVLAHIDTTGLPFQSFENIPYQLDSAGHIHIEVPATYQGRGQKVSYDGAAPWIGVQYQQVALMRRSPPLDPAQFAPKAGELEVYVDDDTDYIEVEIQGPYSTLLPGETAHLRVEWQLRDAPPTPEAWWSWGSEAADSLRSEE